MRLEESVVEAANASETQSKSSTRRAIFKELKKLGFLGHSEEDGFFLRLTSEDGKTTGIVSLEDIEGYSMTAVEASYHEGNEKALAALSANNALKRAFKQGLISEEKYISSLVKY